MIFASDELFQIMHTYKKFHLQNFYLYFELRNKIFNVHKFRNNYLYDIE